MEYRQLGSSGLKVPILTFGTGTFGGQTEFFKPWGASDVKESTRLVDVCLDAGLTMFDTADVYARRPQLTQNLGAVGWNLTPDQIARLDAASATTLPYRCWHQRGFAERNPPPV